MSNTQYGSGDVIDVIAPANVAVNEVVAQGGVVGVAQNTVLSGQGVPLVTTGIQRLPKLAGFAPAVGSQARYSRANKRLQSDGDLVVGIYAAAAGSADDLALVLLGRFRGEAQVVVDRVRVVGAANAARTGYSIAPFAGVRKAFRYVTDAKPTSAGGTWLLSAVAGGNTQLSTATVAATGFTEDAITALTPTATAANLVCAEGDLTEVKLVSNNADGVPGAGIDVFITYERG